MRRFERFNRDVCRIAALESLPATYTTMLYSTKYETLMRLISRFSTFIVSLYAAILLSFSGIVMADTALHAAVSHPDRPAEETARDAGRKPEQVLAFYNIQPGMNILELAASGGYYTEILSHAVGEHGQITAQYYESFWPRLKDTVEPRYQRLGNITPYVGDPADYKGGANSLDAVFIVLIYHHMHFAGDEGENLPTATKKILANIYRMLKPGGIVAIIEHQAPDATSRAESAEWHRTPADMTIEDLTSNGFEFAGRSDVLTNPDDPLTTHFGSLREQFGRDSSQRYVLKFRKPN